ncbi:NUDIX domain-containing protein [Streptomyces albipurpureus]|uniref:NUDIX domain-containing protein n=1 Tax=Streptomyces albipurpureus TaxID=2897419 RepID=A0ABT0UED6_9ACTN|nr:NUDIX domain-containing protein [Streptomyces sp. CWNU-1]MCM2386887.1 NUDIX domain-containing protein [Streptomyces sp. CWNU-1]
MATKRSAGLLLFRIPDRSTGLPVEVLIGHMGGPFWQNQDGEAWSTPKGEYTPDEEPMAAARREFEEELGFPPPDGVWLPLGEARQPSGKINTIWAMEADLDTALFVPGTFTMEWPPRSGRRVEFPEIDQIEWTGIDKARSRLVPGQLIFLDRLEELLSARRD